MGRKAGAACSHTFVAPMLAAPVDVPPVDDEDYVAERKQDGWRALAGVSDAGVWMETRTGKRITSPKYLHATLGEIIPADTVLDGEIVDLSGGKQWNRTQTILSRHAEHKPTPEDPALTYVVFDVLVLDGVDLRRTKLAERRDALEGLLATYSSWERSVQLIDQAPVSDEFVAEALEAGYEGVVCKRVDSLYMPGARNRGWVKFKPDETLDAVCTGTYEPSKGSKYEGRAVGGITFKLKHADGRETKAGARAWTTRSAKPSTTTRPSRSVTLSRSRIGASATRAPCGTRSCGGSGTTRTRARWKCSATPRRGNSHASAGRAPRRR